MTGPDFLCIGMQKAGTSWLFDQLQHHPDFWMPPIKELHYFDKETIGAKKLSTKIVGEDFDAERMQNRRKRKNLRPLEERDLAFLKDYSACQGKEPDVATYAALFIYKENQITGDITPSYSMLDDETISRITGHLAALKVVLLLRDPVARAWSQISMAHRRGRFNTDWADDPETLAVFLGKRALDERSFPTRIYQRWQRYVPAERLRFFFFDNIVDRPDETRTAVVSFLGGDATRDVELTADFNRKSEQARLELTAVARDGLVRHFGDEVRRCADVFGGPAERWPAKYGL